jgi:hypothetical protein
MEHQQLRYSRTNRNEFIRGGFHFFSGLANVPVIAEPTSNGYGALQNNRFSGIPRILGFTRSPHPWPTEKAEDGFSVHSSPLLVSVREKRTDGPLSKRTWLRSSKHLNNPIEQDHRKAGLSDRCPKVRWAQLVYATSARTDIELRFAGNKRGSVRGSDNGRVGAIREQ